MTETPSKRALLDWKWIAMILLCVVGFVARGLFDPQILLQKSHAEGMRDQQVADIKDRLNAIEFHQKEQDVKSEARDNQLARIEEKQEAILDRFDRVDLSGTTALRKQVQALKAANAEFEKKLVYERTLRQAGETRR